MVPFLPCDDAKRIINLSLYWLATKFLNTKNANFRSWAVDVEISSAAKPGNSLLKITLLMPLYYATLLNLVPTIEDLHK